MMKNYSLFLWLFAIAMLVLPSCKDNEDVYDTADYKYYLIIQSQVSLNLNGEDEEQGTMSSDSRVDLMSRTIFYMKQAVVNNESMQVEKRMKESALFTTLDSLYRNYAEMNPENRGSVVCFVKLMRSRINSDGTIRDAVPLKYYQFWMEKPDYGDDDGGDDSHDYLEKPETLEAIDLGLSVLWANCNIGADQPRNYGAHLAWGDSTGILWSGRGIGWKNNGYTWDTDNYGGNNPPADIAGTALDIVTVKWGEDWHIPTYEQALELCEQCQWKLQTYGDIKWYEVIGPNGNSIIMPLAGLYGDDVSSGYRFQAGPYGVTERGYYWTSTSCATPGTSEQRGYGVNEGVVTAWCFRFNSNDGDDMTPVFVDHLRAMHLSIRPVHDK